MIGHKSLWPTSFGSTNTPGPLLRARRLVSLSPTISPLHLPRLPLPRSLSQVGHSLFSMRRDPKLTQAEPARVSGSSSRKLRLRALGRGRAPSSPLGGGGAPKGPLGAGTPQNPRGPRGRGRGFGPFRGRGSASRSLRLLALGKGDEIYPKDGINS